jgi:hypothetical protein
VPGYAADLIARRAALAALRARRAEGPEPPYWLELAALEQAGYLEEYVWHFRRGAEDVDPPAGLDLAGFAEFRARKLAGHLFQSGARVRIHTTRPLPVAADVN